MRALLKRAALAAWPYLRRALRVFAYAALPAAVILVAPGGHLADFFVALRIAAAAALAALLDKGRMAYQDAKAEG